MAHDTMAFGLANLLAASDVVVSNSLVRSWCTSRTDCRLFLLAARLTKGLSMGRIPEELRRIIAANIRAERMKKYPGRGGGKRCAEAFGVTPQQWSPWERGTRSPDEFRLRQLAEFFGVTVEHLRCDHSPPDNKPNEIDPAASEPRFFEPSLQGAAGSESEIVWQVQRMYSGVAKNGLRLHVSFNIMLAKDVLLFLASSQGTHSP